MIITGRSADVPPRDLHDGKTVFHVKKRVLIGPAQGARNYVMRLFTLGKGGMTPYHTHPWEHEVFIVQGKCLIKSGMEEIPVAAGDFAFVPPNEAHQFVNAGDEPLEFICVVPKEGEPTG
ncbi:cupin domain-containing protein [Candidatus Acetothermia bacterium]|jgi:quercetin dioxygenase-like cupin family protein|nr:cupin domain-containing protein [Candidatus Bipolaricaulota bacterium]RLE38029.1 MAG: cupin domain-containing protein [Candidatus Acetothermia bacterium]